MLPDSLSSNATFWIIFQQVAWLVLRKWGVVVIFYHHHFVCLIYDNSQKAAAPTWEQNGQGWQAVSQIKKIFGLFSESESVKNDEIHLMIEIKTQAVGGVLLSGVIPIQLVINPLTSDQDKRRDHQ